MFTRLLGAKQIGQLTFFHYVVGISIGSIAGTTSVSGQVSAFEGVASIAVWSLMAVITTWISLKSRAIRGWLEGRPVVVIKNGQIMEENLTHARMNLDDLSALLRSKGAFEVADVEFAVLETTGEMSLLLKSQHQPLTAGTLKVPTEYHGLSTKLVIDGRIQTDNLKLVHLSEAWLCQQLAQRGITDLSEVIYAELDTSGKLYVDRRQDSPEFGKGPEG
ncbi:MAG TPA: DUF421 domain-containing protein [Symbiobacteriaceae bacterium]|nr:DUF421 domain-containing protein [Symbiobacteriaceae bacterium]